MKRIGGSFRGLLARRARFASAGLATVGVLGSVAGCSILRFPDDAPKEPSVGQGTAGGGRGGGGDGGGGDGGGDAPSRWEGFERAAALGDGCAAAYALEPGKHYGKPRWIPCPSGEAGCESLLWDGEVGRAPGGGGNSLAFRVDHALDATGRLARVLITHRYWLYDGVNDSTPYEAVAYDWPSGDPVAAWRNESVSGESCAVALRVASETLWVVAAPSRSEQVVVASGTAAAPPSTFRVVDLAQEIFLGRVATSNVLLGLEQGDGKLGRVGLTGAGATTYGPGQRLWLHDVAGADLLAGSVERDAPPPEFDIDEVTERAAPSWFLLDEALAFQPLAVDADGVLTDGVRLVWWRAREKAGADYGSSTSSIEVRTAPLPASGGTVGEGTLVATVDAWWALQARVADGVLGMTVTDTNYTDSSKRALLIDLATGTVRSVAVDSGLQTFDHYLAGVDANHLWFTASGLGSEESAVKRYTPR